MTAEERSKPTALNSRRHDSTVVSEMTGRPVETDEPAAVRRIRIDDPGWIASSAFWLSAALLLVVALAAGLTLFVERILTGPAAMNGSARGTAAVLLFVSAPVLAIAMGLAARGSVRAVVIWLGALGVIAYNAQMLLYATPFNQLFLLYVAMLGLAVASAVALLAPGTTARIAQHASPSMPVKTIAGYLLVVAVLNTAIWLRTVIPAVANFQPSSFLEGTGLTTNPGYVQDLALWLPLAMVGAVWLWQRRPWGYPIAGGMLTLWVLESITIAADQWWGSQADPDSTVVGAAMTPAFAVFAVVGLVPLVLFLRGIRN